MVTGDSRWLSALLIPTRHAQDLFAGWWQLIHALGAVPRTLVRDGEGAIGRWRGGRIELTGDCQAFRGGLGAKLIVLRPAEPEHKGIIERAHDYLERSFLPGRTFAGSRSSRVASTLSATRHAVGSEPTGPNSFAWSRRSRNTAPPSATVAARVHQNLPRRVCRRPPAGIGQLRGPALHQPGLFGQCAEQTGPGKGHEPYHRGHLQSTRHPATPDPREPSCAGTSKPSTSPIFPYKQGSSLTNKARSSVYLSHVAPTSRETRRLVA